MGHLKDVNEGYFEHFRHAFELGSVLFLASFGQFAHAIIPDLFPPLGSDVRSLIKFLESKLPENRE